MIPVLTDEAPAPDEILNVICCTCKVSSKSPCGRGYCSCHSHSFHCVAACGDCQGTEFQNCGKCEALTDDTNEIENLDDDVCDSSFLTICSPTTSLDWLDKDKDTKTQLVFLLEVLV